MQRTFKKRPVEVEAMQFIGEKGYIKTQDNALAIREWVGRENCDIRNDSEQLAIHTLEGTMTVSPGDWVIKGVQGEFYPCKPDIFAETYLSPMEWELEYAPKVDVAAVETAQAEPNKEWIERQEEERRAWAIGSATEVLRSATEWDQNALIKLAKEIEEYVTGTNKDLNDVDATDTFYLVMSSAIEASRLMIDDGMDLDEISEWLIGVVDILAKSGVRLKDGTRFDG